MGFEPTTSCLGSKHSTPELRPLALGTQAGAPAGQVYQNVSAESGDTKIMGRCLSRGTESVGIRRELRKQISGLGRARQLCVDSHGQ